MTRGYCQYPIMDRFASSARPKLCKIYGHAVLVDVPYHNAAGDVVKRQQTLCIRHAMDVAVWNFIRNVPRQQLDEDEIAYLLAVGYTADELMADGLMMPEPTSDQPVEVVIPLDDIEC